MKKFTVVAFNHIPSKFFIKLLVLKGVVNLQRPILIVFNQFLF